MAQNYTEYLAINVLNEQQLISYRSLSRALKVHSNLAKQMLYEFHRKQNAKKPGSVHATYLITGVRQPKVNAHTNGMHSQEDGEDTVMQSSPLLPSSSAPKPEEDAPEEPVSVRSVLLVREEHLAQAKATFESITGIHIYSLQANGLSDVQSLTECNRKIAVSYATEDPLQAWKQYGTIQNPNVRRRAQRREPPPPAPVAKSVDAKTKPLAPTTKPTVLEKQASKESQESKPASKPYSAKATPEPAKKPATVKRQDSNIFKSFAKGKTKPKNQESQSSAEASPAAAGPEDEPTGGFSDEDDAEDGAADDVEEVPKVQEGKSKREREADLQAMMDQEDEIMQDAAEAISEKAAEEDEGALDKPNSQQAEEPKDTVTVENGRRRGKRRIMKKKTVKDEDGYLVTKEEPAWESFSEDEPAPKKIKVPSAAGMNKPASKKGGKPGQGNIMSFFGKK